MKIRTLVAAVAVAAVSLFPLASPARATHNCGFDPCPHPSDVVDLLCWKFPALDKYIDICPN